jgi:hypothetical protein
MKPKKILIFCAGVFAGAGVVIASLSGAATSVIPYSFKDGQVISADTFNDLFSQLNNATQGISNESSLNGAWSCTTYDSTSGNSKSNGMPNANFALDSNTGLQSLSQTWTFSNNGTNLSMNLAAIGGIGASANNTGVCGGATSFNYNTKAVESSLMLSGTGCLAGNGYVLPISMVSPYKFRVTVGTTVVACVANAQPPAIPSALSAVAGTSGVTLTWTDNGGGATAFNVLKKVNGSYTQLATTGGGVTTYLDSNGASGALYRVQSTNANGNSLSSTAALAQ